MDVGTQTPLRIPTISMTVRGSSGRRSKPYFGVNHNRMDHRMVYVT